MIRVEELNTMAYRAAWARQEAVHGEVAAGGEERILLVEHPPVITLGRRGQTPGNLLASEEYLLKMGVELVHSDRGGDITFHGPGQIVAYPIIRLADHGLSVGGYVRSLEMAAIGALAELGVSARRVDGAVGVWTDDEGEPAKICAIGVRIRRGISLHGLAMNVRTDLRYFNLIVPCGLTGKPVTSLEKLLGDRTPAMGRVKEVLVKALQRAYCAAGTVAETAAETVA
jgi:lipoyl(octanoyl) transferase